MTKRLLKPDRLVGHLCKCSHKVHKEERTLYEHLKGCNLWAFLVELQENTTLVKRISIMVFLITSVVLFSALCTLHLLCFLVQFSTSPNELIVHL